MISKRNKVWHMSCLEQVFKRRFLLLHQACEFFTRHKKSYFFNLLTEDVARGFFVKLKEVVKEYNRGAGFKTVKIIENPS